MLCFVVETDAPGFKVARDSHILLPTCIEFHTSRDVTALVTPQYSCSAASSSIPCDDRILTTIIRHIGREALGKLHSLGVCHCDVKPANILFGPDGSAFLCDFGSAQEEGNAIASTTCMFTFSDARGLAAATATRAWDLSMLLMTVLHLAGIRPKARPVQIDELQACIAKLPAPVREELLSLQVLDVVRCLAAPASVSAAAASSAAPPPPALSF